MVENAGREPRRFGIAAQRSAPRNQWVRQSGASSWFPIINPPASRGAFEMAAPINPNSLCRVAELRERDESRDFKALATIGATFHMPTARSSPLLVLAALAVAGAAGGCTRPGVALKPPAFQQQADAVRDWQAVATQIATDMQRDGFLPDPGRPGAARAVPPYYVNAPLDSQFLREVAAALRSEILARGGTVAQRQPGAAVIDLTVDIVRWPPRDRAPDGLGTELGLASGTAVVLANQAPLVPAAGFGLLAGAGIVSDLLRTMTPHTNTEVAWGATIALGDRIVFEVRYPMYIGDNDWRLYAAPQPQIVQLRYAP